MRFLGILCMALSLTGVGFLLAERKKERVKLLLQLRLMVHYLKSQILYSNATLPEAIFEVGNQFYDKKENRKHGWHPVAFFQEVGRLLEKKRNCVFSDLWRLAVDRIPSGVSLTKGDREKLSAVGENLGYADRNMQERTLLFYLEQLDETIREVKEDVEKLGKLYRTLGVAAGMFWFVLFI